MIAKAPFFTFFEEVGRLTLLFEEILKKLFLTKPTAYLSLKKKRKVFLKLSLKPRGKRLVEQLVEVGVNSLPIVVVTAAFIGMVLCYLGHYQFNRLGIEVYTASLVAAAMVTELGPLVVAITIAGRIGASTTAQIGSMKITEQLDALRMLGVDPIEYLALPRFISAVLMLPILTIFANSAGILAGYFLGVCIFGIPSPLYVNKTLDYLIFSDIIRGLIKSSLFGGIISLLSSFFGFRTKEGAEGLGRSVTAAVVSSYTAILICDYFFTLLLF